MKAVSGLRENLAAIFDDSPGTDTLSLTELRRINPDVVLVASLTGQDRMRRKLEKAGFNGQILLPFASDDELGTIGLLSYVPENDWCPSSAIRTSPQPTATHAPSPISPLVGNKAKILMIQPPFSTANHRHKKTMPLGLLYVAAALRKRLPDADLRLFDAHIHDTTWLDMTKLIDETDFNILAIGYWSAQAKNAYLISDYARSVKPDVVIIHGGVHATLRPEEALAHCDYVVKGEGEQALGDLVEGLLKGKPQPSFIESNFITNLDSLPFPAWDLLHDTRAYDHAMHVVGGLRFPIIGSRGCPFSCTFCSSPIIWKRKVRWRGPENVVDEMDAIFTRYGVSKFHFWDDNMVMNREWMSGLIDALRGRRRSYQWVGLSRASDIIRQEALLPIMRDAGCVGVEVGVESFTDQVSDNVEKGETSENTSRAAALLKASGIAPLYTHMLFTPGETIASYRSKEIFMNELRVGVPSSFKSDSDLGQLTTPHVKTKFAEDAAHMGRILWRKADDSHHHRVNFLPDSLLDDIPRRLSDNMPSPLPYLTIIVQSIYDWTENRMRGFVRSSPLLWEEMDGIKSVRKLAESIAPRTNMDPDEALAHACLLVALWARDGHIC